MNLNVAISVGKLDGDIVVDTAIPQIEIESRRRGMHNLTAVIPYFSHISAPFVERKCPPNATAGVMYIGHSGNHG